MQQYTTNRRYRVEFHFDHAGPLIQDKKVVRRIVTTRSMASAMDQVERPAVENPRDPV